MAHKTFLFSIIFLFHLLSFSQTNEDSLRSLVLHKNIPDSTFTYGKWNVKNGQQLTLNYLGEIKSETQVFKVMTSFLIWGAKRGTSRIIIFNQKNEYLGDYYVYFDDLPYKIIGHELYFFEHSKNCKKNTISFNAGVPLGFLIKCGNKGDFYEFGAEPK